VRVPLLDKEVIDIATRIDWRSCLDVGRRIGKLPLRSSLGRHVRRQTWNKRGFTVCIDSWFRGALRSVFEDTVLSREEILGFPMNKKALFEMFNWHLSEQANYGWGLWTLLSVVLWEKKHYDPRIKEI
jgi:asparagine synthase (glutamine-hydrolysing)